MKPQVVVIHGGETFATYEDYLSDLVKKTVDIDNFKTKKDWKATFAETLGEEYDTLNPRMPNGQNARYEEWKIWFEKLIPFLNDGVTLIGHSLGGIFLSKYLSQNAFPKTIKTAILVAAPFRGEGLEESLGDFTLPESLATFSDQAKSIYLLHSKDDPVVPYEAVTQYQAALPNTELMVFEDRGHFVQEALPELTDLVRKL